jgi:xanthine dehydrogenase accessory factor
MDVLAEAARLGAVGAPAALATVLRTSGSTPRHAAAKMIVGPEGILVGTIGGGRIEHEVIAAARAVATGGAALRVERNLGADLGMCCGGKMDVFVEPLDRARSVPLGEASRRRERRLPCALVTDLDGHGKDLRDADPCLVARRARLDGASFIEPILPTSRLILFGAGHIARALAPLAAATGFEVVICDEDEQYLSAERFPGARLVGSFAPGEVASELVAFGPGDHVIIVTRDHGVDQEILESLLGKADLAFLGLVGSRAKVARFHKRIAAKGRASESDWARLRAPVGIDIGAETPAEIAISILAELVATRAGKP